MPEQPILAGRPGFFGKLPCRGDFVSRNLPRSFLDPWDQWLQHGIAAAKAALDDAWPHCFIDGPSWKFVVAAGILGPQFVIGLLAPSRDRVGRLFPLTIAILTNASPDSAGAATWLSPLVPLTAQARAGQLDPDQLMVALDAASLGSIARVEGVPPPVTDTRETPAAALPRIGTRESLWWTAGNARMAASWLRCPALPPAEKFHAFYSGQWAKAGWGETPSASGGSS